MRGMSPISRGFHRKREEAPAGRVPPGQYATHDFPVLSAGPTPHTPLEDWTFSITQGGETKKSSTWQEFRPATGTPLAFTSRPARFHDTAPPCPVAPSSPPHP